jgi:hypothetical protein
LRVTFEALHDLERHRASETTDLLEPISDVRRELDAKESFGFVCRLEADTVLSGNVGRASSGIQIGPLMMDRAEQKAYLH